MFVHLARFHVEGKTGRNFICFSDTPDSASDRLRILYTKDQKAATSAPLQSIWQTVPIGITVPEPDSSSNITFSTHSILDT